MRSIFDVSTLRVKSISFKTFLLSLLFFLLIVISCELILRIDSIRSRLPALSIGQTDRYPELDIKLQRLNELVKSESINCFLVGSSMVDAGIDPQILSIALNETGNVQYQCFNFGLSGAMVETAGTMMEFLAKNYSPDLIILGTSAIEFDQNFVDTRDMGEIPWIQYRMGQWSFEGWLVDHSLLYRSMLTYQKIRQSDFEDGYQWWEQLINQYGFRDWKNQDMDVSGIDEILLRDFQLNPVDLDHLGTTVELQDQGIRVEIVEMPVYPSFLPNYIEGGEAAYKSLFITPLTDTLQAQGNNLILSQPSISSVVTEDGWYNKNHLNAWGAKLFSTWLGQQIMKSNQ